MKEIKLAKEKNGSNQMRWRKGVKTVSINSRGKFDHISRKTINIFWIIHSMVIRFLSMTLGSQKAQYPQYQFAPIRPVYE